MQAYSTVTDTTYPSWEALLDAETNGYAVVGILQRVHPKSGRTEVLARTVGPFSDWLTARNRASSLRRKRKRAEAEGGDRSRQGVCQTIVGTGLRLLFAPVAGTRPASDGRKSGHAEGRRVPDCSMARRVNGRGDLRCSLLPANSASRAQALH